MGRCYLWGWAGEAIVSESIRDYFSWDWRKRYELMIKVRPFPCPDCGGSGNCVNCDGCGCFDCVESSGEVWGDCVQCGGRGDYFVQETMFSGRTNGGIAIYESPVVNGHWTHRG